MLSFEAKLVFTIAMTLFATAVLLASIPVERYPLTRWLAAWMPRFDFDGSGFGKEVTQRFYFIFFLIWIPIIWLFD